jgi:hypothetical protein
LDEEKSTYGILPFGSGKWLFSPAKLLSLGGSSVCSGWYKAQQTGAPAREECNKYDLTAAPYF